MRQKTVLGAVLATALMGLGAAAHAQYTAIVSTAPPPPRHEVVPAPRHGMVWAPGHWEWRGNEYVWLEGRWLTARAGYEYREPRWVQRANGDWVMVGGNWERGAYGDRDHDGVANMDDQDRDGDGIPNRLDPHPNRYDRHAGIGPNGDLDRDGIANRYDRDRDGDGIRNGRDRFPNNPRRS